MTEITFRADADASPRDCVTVRVPGADRGRRLSLRLDVVNHSPTGFGWGYGGSGPAQLAVAILAEVLPMPQARALYQDFKWEVVAKLPMDRGWTLTESEIRAWAANRPTEAVA